MAPQKKTYNLTHIRVPGKNIQFNPHTGPWKEHTIQPKYGSPEKNLQFNPHTGSRKEHTIQPTYSSPEVIYFKPLIIPWKEHTIQPTYGSPERTYNSTHVWYPGKKIKFNPLKPYLASTLLPTCSTISN